MFDINTLREISIAFFDDYDFLRFNGGYFSVLEDFESFGKKSFLKLESIYIHINYCCCTESL